MSDTPSVNQPEYWDSRYRANETGWDTGGPTPVFVDLVESKRLSPGKALVLGSGRGYDALLFARHGFDVTAIDFSGEAIKHARQLANKDGVTVDFVQEDVFDYSLGLSDEFDHIIEYVTYCAIDPLRRAEFAAAVTSMLKHDGTFTGLFFPLDERQGGPPFAVSMDEVHRLFGRRLELISVEAPVRSIPPRKGKELLTIWKRTR